MSRKGRVSKTSREDRLPTVFRCGSSSTIYDVLRSRPKWQECTDSQGDNYDFNWTDVHWVHDNIKTHKHPLVNHYRNHYELTRKDLLIKNWKRMRKGLSRSGNRAEAEKYNFCPTSFVLPADYNLFLEEFRRTPGQVWIMKPVGRAQGRGIFLITRLSQISEWRKSGAEYQRRGEGPQVETYIVQRYIANPYTVGAKKFDMRIYCLVTSWTPLVAWLYRGGFCRFSISKYSNKKEDIGKTEMHLTNNAIQKKADDYGADGVSDCKWPLTALKLHIASKHGREAADRLFRGMQEVIIRALLCCQKVMIQDRNCFELYGYDIMIDSDLKPWLIEVNASPSLSASGATDYELKAQLLDDMLHVLRVDQGRDRNHTADDRQCVGGYDLIWSNGPVSTTEHLSYLGCQNHASRPLKHIIKRSILDKKDFFKDAPVA